MMVVMLVTGIALLLAGLLAIGFGIPVQEFSFGNTLIITGVVAACTGAIMLGLWVAVRELRNIARQLGAGTPVESLAEIAGQRAAAAPRNRAPGEGGFLFSRDQPAVEDAGGAEPPWHQEAASRARSDAPPAPEMAEAAAPAAKQRRNLLFSSTSRKERERAQARTSEPLPPDLLTSDLRPNRPAAPPAPESDESPPATFDDAWPKSDRSRTADAPPQRRGARTPSTFTETGQPEVTVLKSGVVDGMAYSLYSDGSIEAQMPEGLMRFASIDELRSHLDQRT
jgi:hypothetical protein